MKKILSLVFCLALIGCNPVTAPTTPPPPLIPGATSQFDQNTYRALATAHAFVAQAASNPAVLTRIQKSILNQFIADLNAADVLYAAYHGGTVTQASMQTSLNTVATDQANFAAAGVK